MYGILVVFGDDRHRRSIWINYEESSACQRNEGEPIAAVDHWTNWSSIRPQGCVLTRRSIGRRACCEVNRRSVIECERVGLIVGVDSLQQPAVLIRNHNKCF